MLMVWPLGTRAFLIIGSELLANVMLHLMPREACTAASVCRAWHTGVALSGRLRSVLFLNGTDCAWTARVLTRVFARFSLLEELHFSTEALLPLEAVVVIVRCFSSSLRSLSAFVVSNSVQGRQPAVSELAKITTLESLSLEGTLLTGYSLVEMGDNCPYLRKLSCHEILASVRVVLPLSAYLVSASSLTRQDHSTTRSNGYSTDARAWNIWLG